jgi:hypothetical protein
MKYDFIDIGSSKRLIRALGLYQTKKCGGAATLLLFPPPYQNLISALLARDFLNHNSIVINVTRFFGVTMNTFLSREKPIYMYK